MGPLALTIDDISLFCSERSWASLGAMAVAGIVCLVVIGNWLSAGSRQRANISQTEHLRAEREADLSHKGPPRFNG